MPAFCHATLRAARRLVCPALVIACLPFPAAFAQADYPLRPVTLTVGFGPGTSSDVLARIVGGKAGPSLGQPVVVLNRPGAAGTTATEAVARSRPDGYTLVMGTTSTLLTSPALYPGARYSANQDFTPIALLARTPFVLVAATAATAPLTIDDLVRVMRPGTSSFGSVGAGTIGHLVSALVLARLGVTGTHIPYKSSSQALTEVAIGVPRFATDTVASVLPLVRAGKLRPIAVTSTGRVATLADAPTFAEAGGPRFKGFSLYAWAGLLAPARTPEPVVARIHAAFADALADAAVRKNMLDLELQPAASTPPEFAAFLQAEIPFWLNLRRSVNVKADSR